MLEFELYIYIKIVSLFLLPVSAEITVFEYIIVVCETSF